MTSKILHDQSIIGVAGPTGPVTFWVSFEACIVNVLMQIELYAQYKNFVYHFYYLPYFDTINH